MLDPDYTLGVSPNDLTYVKLYPDANKALFSVPGLTVNTAKLLTVSHQYDKKFTSHLISSDDSVVNPTIEGEVSQSRVYLVIRRPNFVEAADVQLQITRIKTLVDDTAFLAQVLNGES